MAESNTKKNSTQKLPLSVFHTDGGSFVGVFRILLRGYKTGRTPHAAVLAIRAIPCLYSGRKRGIRAGCFCRLFEFPYQPAFGTISATEQCARAYIVGEYGQEQSILAEAAKEGVAAEQVGTQE